MTATEQMTTRAAHYTALIETMDARGATKLHAGEREQLVQAADALLFAEPESGPALDRALRMIDRLRESDRWPEDICQQLRDHLMGCGPPPVA
jgi:hypothetical protein